MADGGKMKKCAHTIHTTSAKFNPHQGDGLEHIKLIQPDKSYRDAGVKEPNFLLYQIQF